MNRKKHLNVFLLILTIFLGVIQIIDYSKGSPLDDPAIEVDGNTDLRNKAFLNGWDTFGRDGSATNPFRIGFKTISVGISGRLIEIVNTDLYIDIWFCTLTGESTGISLDNTSNVLINGCDIQGTSNRGVSIIDGKNVNVTGSTFKGNGYGVAVSQSNYSLISGNTIEDSRYQGIYVNYGFFNTITGNTIHSTWYYSGTSYGDGIRFWNSANNTVSDNIIHSNVGSGVYVYSNTFNTTIEGNTIYNHTENTGSAGIRHSSTASTSIINNNEVYDNFYGISAYSSNTLSSNYVHNNSVGITLSAERNVAINNTLVKNGDGFKVSSNNNSLIKNRIMNSSNSGIYLNQANDAKVLQNTLEDCTLGIFFVQTRFTTMNDNILKNNSIRFNSFNYDQYAQEEMLNNSFNGKPIVHLKDIHDPMTIPTNAAQVFLMNCSNIVVTDLHLTRVAQGIITHSCDNITIKNSLFNASYPILFNFALELQNTNNSKVYNNVFMNNRDCISGEIMVNNSFVGNYFVNNGYSTDSLLDIDTGMNNVVSYNEFENNHASSAIALQLGSFNTVFKNKIHNITGTSNRGIVLYGEFNSSIYWNKIENTSGGGIYSTYSDYNSIFTNDFKDNFEHAVYFSNSDYNAIQFNNFSYNNIGSSQAYDSGISNLFRKNYWNEEVGDDLDTDGYLDSNTYTIEGGAANVDPVLLANPYTANFPSITSPNGGESLSGNITVHWSLADDFPLNNVFTYDLFFSTDSGVTWNEIDRDLVSNSYIWNTLGDENSSNYLLKVLAFYQENATFNDGGIILEDISGGSFTIENVAHYLTSPMVINPLTGEIVTGIISIQWNAAVDTWGHSYPVMYDVYYSKDDGNTWISHVSTASTSALWDSTLDEEGINYKIKVVASSTEVLISEYVSGTFQVLNHGLSEPTILSPTLGEEISGELTIEWSPSIDSMGYSVNYSVFYSTDGSIWTELADGLVSEQYVWNTTSVSDDTNYIVKVVVTNEQGFMKETQLGPFTILNADVTPPVIVIISPTPIAYSESQIWLNFTINEPVLWIGYSLNGASNVTITGNTLLSLSEGTYALTLFATDVAGNHGIPQTVSFTIVISSTDTTSSEATTTEPVSSGTPGLSIISILFFAILAHFYRRKFR